MSSGYPKYTSQARQGNAGVQYVSQVVSNDFGWILRVTHQEHDFGIDGQFDIVNSSNEVTGKIIACQIKSGDTYFRDRNRTGYVYRGDMKHLNYLSNHPLPVIIIIHHPKLNKAYWVEFDPSQVAMTSKAWKMTIPFENEFDSSKKRIERLAGDDIDYAKGLQDYWEMNSLLSDMGVIFLELSLTSSEPPEKLARNLFDRLKATKELALSCQGKVEIGISGFDDDSRELYEIKEVRDLIKKLDAELGELFYFVQATRPTYTLKLFATCQSFVDRVAVEGTMHCLEIDLSKMNDFMNRHWPGLNEMAEWVGLSEEEIKKISLAIKKELETSKI